MKNVLKSIINIDYEFFEQRMEKLMNTITSIEGEKKS